MGLDNIPTFYPCAKAKTAVMVPPAWVNDPERKAAMEEAGVTPEPVIDCKATQRDGGCPYLNAQPPAGLVLGMFGTDCWYRGKYGAALGEKYLGVPMDRLWGDGSNPDGEQDVPDVSPDTCLALADDLEAALGRASEVQLRIKSVVEGEPDGNARGDIEYLIWYLRWAANNTNGLLAWY